MFCVQARNYHPPQTTYTTTTPTHKQKISDLLESGGAETEAYRTHEAALKTFLSSYTDALDVGTTVALLSSYGRTDEVAHFAAARGDHEALLEQLLGSSTGGGGSGGSGDGGRSRSRECSG